MSGKCNHFDSLFTSTANGRKRKLVSRKKAQKGVNRE
jgi:hypothetical protein